MRTPVFLCFLCGLPTASCASAPSAQLSASAPCDTLRGVRVVSERAAVRARMFVQRAGTLQQVTDGQQVRSGERFEIRIDANQPVYATVAHATPGGTTRALYPDNGPGVRLTSSDRLPGPGQWFEFDDETGDENLFVVLSTRPMKLDDLGLQQEVDDDAARPSKVSASETGRSKGQVGPMDAAKGEEEAALPRLTMSTRSACTRGVRVVSDEPLDTGPYGVRVFRIRLLHR